MPRNLHCALLLIFSCIAIFSDAQISQKYFGRPGRSNIANTSAILRNGNRVAVGYAYNGTNTVGSDALITCLDPSDNVLWTKEFATANTDRFTFITATSDTGMVVLGYANATNGVTSPTAVIMKFSSTGNVIWTKLLKNNATNGDLLFSVTEMPNGHIVCGGAYNYAPNVESSMLVDLDASGNILWSKAYNGNGSDEMHSVMAKGGDIIGLGFFQGSSFFDGYIAEFDENNGNVKWARSFDMTSTLTGNTGNWAEALQLVGNKLYADVFNFNSYTPTSAQHSLVSFDTSGLTPLCLEYKFASSTLAGIPTSLVLSPTEIYFAQSPNTAAWDPNYGTSNSTMLDAVVFKVNSMNATNLTPVFTRKMGNTGEQTFKKMNYDNGKIVAFEGVRADLATQFGSVDIFKLEADTGFSLAGGCATNTTAPQFANPVVSINPSYTFSGGISSITWSSTSTSIFETPVSLFTSVPCNSTTDTIINKYAAVTALIPCSNTFTVDTATGFAVGDTVLMIQMKGAVIDTSNSASFGNILDYKGAGNYEFNIVKAVSGNNITLRFNPRKLYDIPNGRVQFVRVPYFQNYSVVQPHTCLPWNGSKGGVLVINASGTVTLNSSLDVSKKGFRTGSLVYVNAAPCGQTSYYNSTLADSLGALKGEGITEVSVNRNHGRGPLANGGGGGNSHNAGGAGGSNAGLGGLGGKETALAACAPAQSVGGIGGAALNYSNSANRIFLGGGAGAGHANNGDGGNGGNGGGIIIVMANQLAGGNFIKADGGNGAGCVGDCWDGQPGGGGGGAVLLRVGSYPSTIAVNAAGGNGAFHSNSNASQGPCGPGGGGGGGAVWLSGASVPSQVVSNVSGGARGIFLNGNNPWGTTDGNAGTVLSGLLIPPFNPTDTFAANNLNPNFLDTVTQCDSRQFIDATTTKNVGVRTWAWTFGDGGSSTLQNPTHTYSLLGTYSVKLVVSDSSGCRDSITRTITVACPDIVINQYAAVLARGTCNNIFTVDSAQNFSVGDTILMIQMKGASIDTNNSASFGNIVSYNGAGNYEYNVIQSISGNNITLMFKLINKYDIPNGRVQFVKTPSFASYTISRGHSCLPWNGVKGGVFAIRVSSTLTMNADINVSGKGFAGGQPMFSNLGSCNRTDYYYPATNNYGGRKGEGIAELNASQLYGRGAQANGGGGGNDYNSGGGGGSNYSSGGQGGNQSIIGVCATTPNIGGVGGKALVSSPFSRAFMGGGGGCGHGDDTAEKAGGNGGGIIFVSAATLIGNGRALRANGSSAPECSSPGVIGGGCANDGGGGGGGGGLIYSTVSTISGNLTVQATGGKGSNVWVIGDPAVGPGGGGSGGAWAFLPGSTGPGVSFNGTGGAAGVLPQYASTPYGALPGSNGQTLVSKAIPQSGILFGAGGPSVSFTDSIVSCFERKMIITSFNLDSSSLTYKWYFNNGAGTSTLRNPSYTFPGYGNFIVTLTVTDSNGCTSSLSNFAKIPYIHFADGRGDTTICFGMPVTLNASGGVSYSWTPTATLSSPNTASTQANPLVTTVYTVRMTDSKGCNDSDMVTITVAPTSAPVIAKPADTTICNGILVQLSASGAATYQWSPAAGLSSTTIANPIATLTTDDATYVVTGVSAGGCISTDTVTIHRRMAPEVNATVEGSASRCEEVYAILKVTGTAQSYRWTPGNYLSAPNSATTNARPPQTTLYTVVGTNSNGCSASDTVTVFVADNDIVAMPGAFTPNGDGRNESIHPMVFCDFTLEEYRIFNRWGQLVFQSNSASNAWNGTFKDELAEAGTYNYLISGKRPSNGQKVIYKGSFALIR